MSIDYIAQMLFAMIVLGGGTVSTLSLIHI